MEYRTCPYCEANLDAEEKCDCRDAEDTARQSKEDSGTDQSKPESVQ